MNSTRMLNLKAPGLVKLVDKLTLQSQGSITSFLFDTKETFLDALSKGS